MIKLFNAYVNIFKQLFCNDKKGFFVMLAYFSLVFVLFFVPSKSYASSFDFSQNIVVVNDGYNKLSYAGSLEDSNHSTKYYKNIVYDFPYFIFDIYNKSDDSYFSTVKKNSWLVSNYTMNDCFDSDYRVLEIPDGNNYQGMYVCSGNNIGLTKNQLLGISEEPEPSEYYTPEKFDEFFCGQTQIKDKLSYQYYDNSLLVDYSVRRSLGSSAVLSGNSSDDTLNIYVCGADGCTYEQLLEDAREVISFLPEERFFAKSSEYGGYYDFEVFAYCKSAIKQISTSDLTSDTSVDCRKGIYQFTGESGSHLTSLPEESCYEEENRDYTFKQWCEAQFSQDSYWLEGQLEEYCDPPEKEVSEKIVDDGESCEITTEILDVGYNTDQTRNDITKTITKKITTKDCDGNVLDEETIQETITVDKTEIQGDGSDKAEDGECFVGPSCPPNNGTDEGTGSGVGEGSGSGDVVVDVGICDEGNLDCEIEAFDPSESWYTPKYTNFNDVLNVHIEALNSGAFGQFLMSLNPFGTDGDFPKLTIDFSFPALGIDFGTHSIDLQNIPVGENRHLNLVLLMKALLLIYASIYAFKQVF